MPPDTIVDEAPDKALLAREDAYLARRVSRHEAQRLLWRITDVRRLAYCGRVVADKAAGVTFRLTGTAGQPGARGGISGLQTCGSVWSCPVCSEKVNAQRQAELQAGLERWVAEGNSIVFGTFTMQHSPGQRLEHLWDAVSPCWSKVTSGPSWSGGKRQEGDRQRFGIAGWCRVVEVTHGNSGWHPHVHALFFVRGQIDDAAIDDMRGRFFQRWNCELGRRGLRSLEFDKDGHAVAVDLRRVVNPAEGMADYFAKNTYLSNELRDAAADATEVASTSTSAAAYEVTGSHSKKARGSGRTPFQLLADLVDVQRTEFGHVDVSTGEILEGESLVSSRSKPTRDFALWREWEETSRGRRQFNWSQGIRDLLGIGVEETDEDIAAAADLAGVPISDIMSISGEIQAPIGLVRHAARARRHRSQREQIDRFGDGGFDLLSGQPCLVVPPGQRRHAGPGGQQKVRQQARVPHPDLSGVDGSPDAALETRP